ncbi:MAG: membrane protein insertase YidC [Oscillospiraceae bacterium]|nr:membrane protein insertase YidC [Oscillospiraceae bacterium]
MGLTLGQIWDFLIVQPIAWLIRTFYNLTGSYGIAIMLFSLAATLALLWFNYKGKRGMLQQQRIQSSPKLQELQKKYAKDRQKLQQEQAKLYQESGVSMFGGCIWQFIPFPIIIALYGAVRRPLTYIMQLSADAIERISTVLGMEDAGGFFNELTIANQLNVPGELERVRSVLPDLAENLQSTVHFDFLGINLADIPSFTGAIFLIPVISAAASFLSVWLTQKFSGRPPAKGNSQLMMYLLGPGVSLWLGFTLPAALGVYWIAQSVLRIPQEYFLTKHFNKVLDAEEQAKAEREERRKAAEAAQKEEDRQRRAERIAEQNKKHKPKRYKLQNKPAPKEETEDE